MFHGAFLAELIFWNVTAPNLQLNIKVSSTVFSLLSLFRSRLLLSFLRCFSEQSTVP